jgi:hypothetical protein
MSKFTKALRQQIVRDFSIRHNGQFNPALFVEEVRKTGPSHPAHEWFEWDAKKAALQYQIEQAREFARDLRVVFTVEEIGRNKAVVVRERVMPLVLSPIDRRDKGGGYVLTDPENPEHMAEHCRQAASALDAWLGRYSAAVDHAGGSAAAIQKQVNTLRLAGASVGDEAA